MGRSERIRQAIPIIIFTISLLVFITTAYNFASISNLINILKVVTFIAIPAIGLAIIMLAGKFDLSFVGVIGMTAVVSVYLTNNGISPWLALLITLVLAVVLELINAFFIVGLKIHPWLTTIATMLLYLGLEKAISGGHYYTAESTFFKLIRF